MVNAILGVICIGSLAAFFVMWAKWEDEKEKRWDDTSVYLTDKKHMSCLIEVNEHIISVQNEMLRDDLHVLQKGQRENHDLQLRLSSILCPTNNHVWVEEILWVEPYERKVCKKCGMVYNG